MLEKASQAGSEGYGGWQNCSQDKAYCRHDIVKGLSHRPLGHGKAWALRVRAVAHQSQHALLADLPEPLQIDGIAEHRRVIHLEISRVHHGACRGVDGQGRRVGNAVVGADKFHPEASSGPTDTEFLFDEFVNMI